MKRKFRCSDLAMLTVAGTLADTFEQEKAVFVAESPYYDDPYLPNFKAAIETILSSVYGINPKNNLKEATRKVVQLTLDAKEDLQLVREQLVRGFRKEPEQRAELLQRYGFRAYWDRACRGQQEAMIGLLFTFRNNLKAEDRALMEARGVSPSRIDRILAAATLLKEANTGQEGHKFTSKENTKDVVVQLNEIFDRTMDICFLGQRLFKDYPAKKEMFTFSKLLSNQHSGRRDSGEDDEAAE